MRHRVFKGRVNNAFGGKPAYLKAVQELEQQLYG